MSYIYTLGANNAKRKKGAEASSSSEAAPKEKKVKQ
jgi:hypothetical protein